ncbi:SoxW family protein [Frigidibacter sp. ROC022]|uniref:SoxW family protein n=1 Tax=Frigidibacter sp. ROC022 TaxID=2971796 RepID=UPI00215A3800|nr:thioredoxin family protein [Frigidibacter sp. ROC022]MCR8726205.1 thioredoxin family protein [Frigidibacter sp. ROC022]
MTRLIAALATVLALALPAQAVELGDDGLHKPDWLRETFKDLRDDLDEANAEGKRLMIIVEQRGCIYCTRMHEEIFPIPEIDAMIRDTYFVVQLNMFGSTEVTDFDGTTLDEKSMARRWGLMFTPTMIFLPEEVPEGETAVSAAVAVMPGAFGKGTTLALLTWVRDHVYDTGVGLQEYMVPRTEVTK